MKAPFNLNVQDIGDCSSNFSICYGSFKLIGGIFSDYIPAEWVFSLGLLLGSAVNFAIASISGGKARFLVWLWGMNGLLQGAGGPALSKMIIDFLPESSRSYTWSSLMNANNIGYLCSSYLLLIPAYYFGWQGPFYFSSVVGGILFLLLTLFPITKKANHDSHIKMATNIEEKLLPQESDWRLLVLNSVKVLSLMAGSIITYFCIKVVSDWTVYYYTESAHIDVLTAVSFSFCSEVGAIAGSVFAGKLADQFPSRRVTICWVFATISLLALFFLASIDCNYTSFPISTTQIRFQCSQPRQFGIQLLFLMVGFGINAPKALLPLLAIEEAMNLITTAPFRMGSRTGTVSGVVGLCCQVGAVGSGAIVANLLRINDDYFLLSLIIATVTLLGTLAFAELCIHCRSFNLVKLKKSKVS